MEFPAALGAPQRGTPGLNREHALEKRLKQENNGELYQNGVAFWTLSGYLMVLAGKLSSFLVFFAAAFRGLIELAPTASLYPKFLIYYCRVFHTYIISWCSIKSRFGRDFHAADIDICLNRFENIEENL